MLWGGGVRGIECGLSHSVHVLCATDEDVFGRVERKSGVPMRFVIPGEESLEVAALEQGLVGLVEFELGWKYVFCRHRYRSHFLGCE